ncbi:MAG: hypothetical protein COA57_12055 [Flavobacteriales bacterium]|nr:MAG: hypothetical protein COA57_12055 [Flavobacteriales bacterium]
MKKITSFLSALLVAAFAMAGNNNCDETEKECVASGGKWIAGMTVSPDFHHYKITNAGFGNKVSHTNFGLTAGAWAEYSFCENFSVTVGANYTSTNYHNSTITPVMTTSNNEMVYNVEMIRNNVSVLEVPVGFKLKSTCCQQTCEESGITVTPVIYAGVNTAFAVSSNKTYRTETGETFARKDNSFSPITAAPEFGFGWEVQLCEKMNVSLMPTYRWDAFPNVIRNSDDVPKMNKLKLAVSVGIIL